MVAVLLSLFTSNLTPMIDFATIFTLATAPVLSYLKFWWCRQATYRASCNLARACCSWRTWD